MSFDLRTLLAVELLTSLASFIVLAFSTRSPSTPGMRAAMTATAALSVAFALFFMRDHWPPFLTIPVANCCLWAACHLIYRAHCHFVGRVAHWGWIAWLGGGAVVFTAAWAAGAGYGTRALLASIMTATSLAPALHVLVADGGLKKERARFLLASMLLIVIGLMVVRVGLLLTNLGADLSPDAPSLDGTLGFLPGVFVTQGFALSFLLLHQERSANEAHAMATTDMLTGCHNRRALEQRAVQELAWAARTGQPCSIILLDLDHFKRINDTWGHHAGDVVLQRAAEVVRTCVRPADVVARVGGEEFCVLLRGCSLDGAQVAAGRITETLRQVDIPVHDATIKVRASIGIAELALGGASRSNGQVERWDHLYRRADEALYRAKSTGRDRIELAS
jgi:diguanylate cyclase (GGDEF)-like protein